MDDYMTKKLDSFAADAFEDGIIEAGKLQQINKRLYAEDVIDNEEADPFFQLNDRISGAEKEEKWDF